ncbi:MAG: hypothetical protein AAGA15_06015 [Pseudomonadota bacterium]
MAQTTFPQPTLRAAPIAMAAAVFAAALTAIADIASGNSTISGPQMAPLSQDAATALHLQSLGKWH